MAGMRKICLLIAVSAMGQHAWPPPGMKCPQRTLVIFESAENHDKAQQVLGEHLAWVSAQLHSGRIVSAGPLAEGNQAVILFASKDWSDVEKLLGDEPFNREHVMKVKSHDVWNACELDTAAAATSPK